MHASTYIPLSVPNLPNSLGQYPIPGKQLMYKILETVDWLATQEDADTTFESFLSDWFLGAKCSELKRDNLVELLAYSMYAKHVAALCEAERTDVSELVGADLPVCVPALVLHGHVLRPHFSYVPRLGMSCDP